MSPASARAAASRAARSRSSARLIAATIRAHVGADRPRARAVRTARTDLRPGRRGALARPGPALAPLPRLAPAAGRRPRARRGDGNGPRGGGAPAARLPRDRARPEPADARGRARRLAGRAELVEASAESLPFADASFDHLTFTYLLRYVDDPGATLAELARAVRPGGTVASLEFGVPGGPTRPLWNLHVDVVLPLAGRLIGRGWEEAGAFLGGSIRDFWARYPLAAQLTLWREAGLHDVQVRRLSLGGGVVMWGRRV